MNLLSRQECIPVGCVPPAHWPYPPEKTTHAPPPHPEACTPPAPGSMHAPLHPEAHTPPHPEACMPPPEKSTHAPQPPPEKVCMLPRKKHACPPRKSTHATPPWTEWQTGAKLLPCPKLRLRAVITFLLPLFTKDLLVVKTVCSSILLSVDGLTTSHSIA